MVSKREINGEAAGGSNSDGGPNGIRRFRGAAKRILATVPPFNRWLAALEILPQQNAALEQALRTSQSETQTATTELQAACAKLNQIADEVESLRRALDGSENLWVPLGHFYSPVPRIRDLKAAEEKIFEVPADLRAIELDEAGQMRLLGELAAFYPQIPFNAEKTAGRRYFFENINYSYSDAIILYCMMRQLRPRRMIEVGSGFSSCAMLDVNEAFFDNSIQFTFIDPYPQLLENSISDSDRRRSRIIGHKLQDVDPSLFEDLAASDILFIDSSHIVKTGSDVNYLLFEILPRLAQGVYIHVHDIFYPFEYPKQWVYEGRAWNEAYLLRAFLQYNNAFRIRLFTTYLIHRHREVFASALPLCLKNPGGSIWLERRT